MPAMQIGNSSLLLSDCYDLKLPGIIQKYSVTANRFTISYRQAQPRALVRGQWTGRVKQWIRRRYVLKHPVIMNVHKVRKNPVSIFRFDLIVQSQRVIVRWFQLLNVSSLAPDRQRQSGLIRSPQPAGNRVYPAGAGAETAILSVRSQSLPDRSEEEICPLSHYSKLSAHDHQAGVVACLDPTSINERFDPRNLVVAHSTAMTKIAPIDIERVRWTTAAHSLKVHRPNRDIDIRREKKFTRFT